MADKNIKKPNGVNATDWNAYLNALDEIEKRPTIDEVEEVVATHRKEQEEASAFAGSWADDVSATDLGSLLIVPDEIEEEGQEEAHNLASLLLSQISQDDKEDALPGAPSTLRNPLSVLASVIFPRRGDSLTAVTIKSSILLTLVALLAALALLVNYLVLMPYANRQLNRELYELYDPENTMTVADTTRYPAGMLASFKELYTRNEDVRGWLSFHSSGDEDVINVEYPVVQTDNNKTYISTDFDKNENKNGTLFFDQKCQINSAQDTSRVLMVYGNSTGSGQMLSGLTNLMGSVNSARSAMVFTLSTLYEKADYYVMAVVLVDGDSAELEYKRTMFADERDFFNHVQAFRDRSLFDYSTDLQEGDELAIIGTTVSSAASHLVDGRLLVLGRRQRPGETASNLSYVAKNEDVIMPFYWYINQKITPHDVYYQEGSTTTQSEETTTVIESSEPTQTDATVDVSSTKVDASSTTGEDTTADAESTTGEDTTADAESTTGEDTTADKDTTTGKDSTTDKDATTVASGKDDPSTTVNKNTYTTSHTYTEEPTTTTSRSVPTGIIITKVPLSTTPTEKEDTTKDTTKDTTEETTEDTTTTTETTKTQE